MRTRRRSSPALVAAKIMLYRALLDADPTTLSEREKELIRTLSQDRDIQAILYRVEDGANT